MYNKNVCIVFFLIMASIFLIPCVYAKDKQLDKASMYLYNRDYKNALTLFEDIIKREKESADPDMDTMYFCIHEAGVVYFRLGQFHKALSYWLQSMKWEEQGGDPAKRNYSLELMQIGMIYQVYGRYQEAISNYDKALAIAQSINDYYLIAHSYSAYGGLYCEIGNHQKALDYYFLALKLCDSTLFRDRYQMYAEMYKKIGFIYQKQKKYKEAMGQFEKALEYDKKYDRKEPIAEDYVHIADIFLIDKKYENSMKYYNDALKIYEEVESQERIASVLHKIGYFYYSQKDYTNAIDNYKNAIQIYDSIYNESSHDFKKSYMEKIIDVYHYLISSYIKKGDKNQALQSIEHIHARQLNYGLSKTNSTDSDWEKEPGTAVLLFSNSSMDDIVISTVTEAGLTFVENSVKKTIKFAQSNFQTRISEMMQAEYQKKKEKESLGIDYAALEKGTTDFENIIKFYVYLLGRNNPSDKNSIDILSRQLYKLLIRPIEHQLTRNKNLLIIPDGILSFLPFETLKDEKGNYLIEKFTIHYAQSLGVLSQIKKRQYAPNRKSVLILGSAVYDKWRYNQQVKNKIDTIIDFTKKESSMYTQFGFDRFSNLPWTEKETEDIAQIMPDYTMLIGQNVTESTLKRMSENKELLQYKILHFATHGMVLPELPDMSALVMSQYEHNPDKEDGFLSMTEIIDLKINADLVTLSACETGLGKLYKGEGIVGLTEAFMLAGANGIISSLWQVNDEFTTVFMVKLYELMNADMSNYEAVRQIKRDAITGKYGERYKNPYYWASFTYWGN